MDFQLRWLKSYGFDRVIMPSKEPIPASHYFVRVEGKEALFHLGGGRNSGRIEISPEVALSMV